MTGAHPLLGTRKWFTIRPAHRRIIFLCDDLTSQLIFLMAPCANVDVYAYRSTASIG